MKYNNLYQYQCRTEFNATGDFIRLAGAMLVYQELVRDTAQFRFIVTQVIEKGSSASEFRFSSNLCLPELMRTMEKACQLSLKENNSIWLASDVHVTIQSCDYVDLYDGERRTPEEVEERDGDKFQTLPPEQWGLEYTEKMKNHLILIYTPNHDASGTPTTKTVRVTDFETWQEYNRLQRMETDSFLRGHKRSEEQQLAFFNYTKTAIAQLKENGWDKCDIRTTNWEFVK